GIVSDPASRYRRNATLSCEPFRQRRCDLRNVSLHRGDDGFLLQRRRDGATATSAPALEALMLFYSMLRIASLGATFALTALCGPRFFLSVGVSLALSHYVLALVYSRKQMRQLAFGPDRATLADIAFPSLVALSMLRYSGWNGYGILHYMLGDVAIPQRPLERL